MDKSTLLNAIALKVGNNSSPERVQEYLNAIYDVILSELELNGEITFMNFGKFVAKERKSGVREVSDVNNPTQKTLIHVEARTNVSFSPSERFTFNINNGYKRHSNKNMNRSKEQSKKRSTTVADLLNKARSRKEKE